MRIGEFAKLFDINKTTVRYYTDLKLLLPIKTGHSFDYDEKCVKDMKAILKLRNMGFKVEEVSKIKTYERLHIDYSENEKEVINNIFQFKIKELNEEKVLLENKISSIHEYKEEILSEKIRKSTGISIEFLNYLICPFCKEELELTEGKIKNMNIFHGTLQCSCGYSIKIVDGILIAHDKEFNIHQKLKKENETWEEKLSKITPELMELIIQSGVRLKSHKKFWNDGSIFIFNDADTDILMMRLNEVFRNDGLYIFTSIFLDTLTTLKRTIETLNVPGKFLFIKCFEKYPLKLCADRVVDNAGNMMKIFTDVHGADTIKWASKYIINNGEILSISLSLKENSKTLLNRPDYKPFLVSEFYKEKFNILNLQLISEEELGKINCLSNLLPMIYPEDSVVMSLYKLKMRK